MAVFLVVVAACESSASGPTSSTSSTTTTIENDTCDRVIADTVRYLENLIAELDETLLREFTDRQAWPEGLVDLERAGRDLDIRVRALRCDPAGIQERAFAEADLNPEGPLSERLLELLLTGEPATDTFEAPTTSSTSVVSETTATTTADGSDTSSTSEVPTTSDGSGTTSTSDG